MAVIFSKKLKKTDIKHRLSVKSSALTSFPRFEVGKNAQVLKVENEGGKEWLFHLIIRRGRYKKPVISGSWLKFVMNMKLEIGDEIVFLKELDEATGAKYKVRVKKPVKKPVKLFKAIIGYAPYPHIN